MTRFLSSIFLLAIIISSCSDEESIPECNVENPMEELEWLKDVKNSIDNCTCQVSIIQGRYKGSTVYYQLMNDPYCNSIFGTVLWDCNGSVVKTYGQNDLNAFGKEVEHEETLHVCKDSD